MEKRAEVPQYTLTEAAYIADRMYQAGETIYFTDVPGHHMKPENAAAKAMVAKYKPQAAPTLDVVGTAA